MWEDADQLQFPCQTDYLVLRDPLSDWRAEIYYHQDKADSDFWTWNPSDTQNDYDFRPFWNTDDSNSMNTISFGVNYPYTVNGGDFWFDETQFNPSFGANFLDVSRSQSHDLNSYLSFKDKDNMNSVLVKSKVMADVQRAQLDMFSHQFENI